MHEGSLMYNSVHSSVLPPLKHYSLDYNENISILTSTSPTGGKPETRRKWSTSTLPSGSPSPVWGKPCPLSPLSPALHWWPLPWSHPDRLRRLKSQASRWEPNSPAARWVRGSFRGSNAFDHLTEQRWYLMMTNNKQTDTEGKSSSLGLSGGCRLWRHGSWNCRRLFSVPQRYFSRDQNDCRHSPGSEEKRRWRGRINGASQAGNLWPISSGCVGKWTFKTYVWVAGMLIVMDWWKLHTNTHLVKVDGHGAVAHLRGFMVGVTDGWKRYPTSSWPDRHAQSVARWLGRRGGVAHHQTLSLQHDWLRVILAPDLRGPPKGQKQQSNDHVVRRKVGRGGRRRTGHS